MQKWQEYSIMIQFAGTVFIRLYAAGCKVMFSSFRFIVSYKVMFLSSFVVLLRPGFAVSSRALARNYPT